MKRGRIGIIHWLGILLLVLFFGVVLPEPIIVAFELALGWIQYLRRTIPQVQVSWPAVATGFGCFVAVLVLGHLIARWLWREMGPKTAGTPAWRPRWTLGVGGVVVLMFAAGIGAVGVAHQSAWLARSEHPIFTRTRETTNRIRCSSNMRQIGHALQAYAEAHDGRLPHSLEPLLIELDLTPEVFVCPSTETERAPGVTPAELAKNLAHHLDYVYHGRGLALPLPLNRPILCEPLINHGSDGMNILFGDGRVEFFAPAEAAAFLARKDRAPTQPMTQP